MSINAGTITAEAALDISQFLKGTQQLQAAAAQINRSFEDIKPLTPRLPTDKLSSDVATGRVALRGLVTELGGIPGLSASASTSLLGVGSGAVGMAAGIATGGAAIAAMIVGMKAAAEQAVALEFSLAAVKSIKLDLDTSAASASLRQLASETGQSAESLAKGLYNLFSSINVPQDQAILLMRKFAQGAVAAQTDASTFGTAIIGVLNAYKLSVADADHVSDIFFNTVRDGVVTGQQLASGLGPITASAKAAGVSLEELGALIVGVTKEGGDAAQNLNNLNNLLQKLVTKETTQSFKDLGISVADASGKLHTPIEILGALRQRLEGLTEAQKANALQEIFPDLQARQGAQVILSQLETIRTALVTNQQEVGSTKTAYQTMAETNAAALKRLQESVASLAVEFGNALLPAMTAVVGKAADIVTGFSTAGKAIDAFLADPQTREAAALLIKLKQQADQAAATGAQAASRAGAAAAQEGNALPIPRVPTEPTAAGLFVETGLGQIGEKGQAGLAAAGAALNALGKAMTGATDESQALAEAFAAAFANAEILAARTRQLEQDDEEAAKGMKAHAAALLAAKDAAANAAAAIQVTATAQERLAAGLAAGIGVQTDWNAALVAALDPAKNLSGVASGPLIEGILKAKQATEDSAKAFEIRDVAIAAEVIRLRDLAAKTTDVAQAQALQKQAGDLAAAALDAQARGQAAATASAAELVKPLTVLTTAVFPELTAAQIAHVKAVEATQGPYEAMAEAAKLAGIDLSQFGDVTQLTGKQLQGVKEIVDATAKGFQGFLADEDKSRIGSVIGTLSSGVDDLTAAEAKQLQATGDLLGAVQLLAAKYGIGVAAANELADAIAAGGVAAFAAREKIAALTTFARDPNNGTIRLKVDVDIEAAERALGKLQQDFRDANAKRAEVETKATREFSEQQSATAQAQSKLGADHAASLLDISRARNESSQQLGRDIGAAVHAQNDALGKVDEARTKAITDYRNKVLDAQATLQQAFSDAAQQYNDGVRALMEQTTTAIEQAAQRQGDALRQAGQAMSAAALATLATLNQQAIAREDLTNRTLIGAHTAQETSDLAAERIRQEAQFGFQNAQSALSQQQARDQLAQAQLVADKELNKTMQDLSKQIQKLADTQTDAQSKAAVAAAITQGLAARDLDTTGRDLNQQAANAGKAAAESFSKAMEEERKRQKDFDDKQRDLQLKEQERLIALGQERVTDPEGKDRTKAEQAFDDAAKARREEQRKGEKDFTEQQKVLDTQIKLLQQIRDNLDRPNVTLGQTTVLETGKDLLTKASQVAQQRLRV